MSLFQEIGKHLENVKSWNPQQAKTEEMFSYIDLSSVDKDRKAVDLNQIQQVMSVDAPSRARQIVKNSDVLVSTVRPNLNGVALVPDALDKATASTGYCVLRANEKTLNAQYLFYWVQTKSFINEMVSKATGANYPAVSDKIIKQSKIPLPPIAEQQEIAAILDAANSLRQKDQQLVERYTALSQSLFLEMFGDPESNSKKLEERLLSEVLDLITYGLTVRPKYVQEGVPLISAREIRSGEVAFESAPRISKSDFEKLSEKAKPVKNDILFSKTGSIGHCALVKTKMDFAISQNAARLTFKPLVNSIYAMHYLKTSYFQRLSQSRAKGNAVKDLQLGDMKMFKFLLPSSILQNQFAERIQLIEAQKQLAQRSLEKSEALFNSLLQRAFTGELTAKMAA